jgi:hypothetical protein
VTSIKEKDIAEEPCGQHTVFEPQCKTCGRIAELRGALGHFLAVTPFPETLKFLVSADAEGEGYLAAYARARGAALLAFKRREGP